MFLFLLLSILLKDARKSMIMHFEFFYFQTIAIAFLSNNSWHQHMYAKHAKLEESSLLEQGTKFTDSHFSYNVNYSFV